MKITMYELLGMVKDNKAPKKIKWNDLIYEKSKYNKPQDCYYRINGGVPVWLLDEIKSLNDEVEIIEGEKKIPEKLISIARVEGEFEYSWIKNEAVLKDKINEIIDYLDHLKRKEK